MTLLFAQCLGTANRCLESIQASAVANVEYSRDSNLGIPPWESPHLLVGVASSAWAKCVSVAVHLLSYCVPGVSLVARVTFPLLSGWVFYSIILLILVLCISHASILHIFKVVLYHLHVLLLYSL